MEGYYWIILLLTSAAAIASVVWFGIKGSWGDHPVFWENAFALTPAALVYLLSFFIDFDDLFTVCMAGLAQLFVVVTCAAGVLSMHIYDRGQNKWAQKVFCYIPTLAIYAVDGLIWINVYEPDLWNRMFGRFM